MPRSHFLKCRCDVCWCLSVFSLYANAYTLIFLHECVSHVLICASVSASVCALPTSAALSKFPFKAAWSGRASSACHEAGVSLGLPLSVRPPRRAQELKHMRKLNRHPNSLPYTKQFKWYSLERWQVLMSLSVLQRGWETGRGMEALFSPSGFCQLCFRGAELRRTLSQVHKHTSCKGGPPVYTQHHLL